MLYDLLVSVGLSNFNERYYPFECLIYSSLSKYLHLISFKYKSTHTQDTTQQHHPIAFLVVWFDVPPARALEMCVYIIPDLFLLLLFFLLASILFLDLLLRLKLPTIIFFILP